MSGAPGNDEEITFGVAGGNNVGNILRDAGNFCGTNAHHVFVIQRLVVDVAGDVLFFESADAVLESAGAGDSPRAREGLGIALVGQKSFHGFREFNFEIGNFVQLGNQPGFGAVSEIAIGK